MRLILGGTGDGDEMASTKVPLLINKPRSMSIACVKLWISNK